MFERYTTDARRAIFFARYEAGILHRRKLGSQSPPSALALLAVATKLDLLISSASIRLDAWSEKEGATSLKRKPWTRKQALGHLVDCAAAHQQWFAAALTEPKLFAKGYPADEWVAAQNYREFDWQDLAGVWVSLNRFLIHVIAQIPPEKLSTPAASG